MTQENTFSEEQETSSKPDRAEETQQPPRETGDLELEELKNQLAQLRKTNQGLYERLKKAEAKLKLQEEEIAKRNLSAQSVAAIDPQEIEERVDLRLEGFSKEELDFISRVRQPGKSLRETAQEEWVKAAIEGIRAKKRVEQSVPPPSSPVFEVLKQEDFAKLSDQERRIKWREILEAQRRKKTERV